MSSDESGEQLDDRPPPVLEVIGLSHDFKNKAALADVGFSVPAKAIHGFVGPNGAGKTTTLKVAATLLKPRRGIVRVFGYDVTTDYRKVRRKIGFMPDEFSLYRQMTVFEYLDFFAAAYGLSYADRKDIISDVLDLTDMGGRKRDYIKGLSRGMQQRVSLARVLVHDPELLLLDEPASGLDPRARIELMEIIRELRGLGKTIFISSHILMELADLCDSVTILDRGRVCYSGGMGDLLERAEGDTDSFSLTLASPSAAVLVALDMMPGVGEVVNEGGGPIYGIRVVRGEVTANDLLAVVLASGGEVVGFERERRDLNEAFMALTKPGVRA